MKRFKESVVAEVPRKPGVIKESFLEGTLPAVIFTEIRTITADWMTRNYTYYPKKSLVGSERDGTGLISFTHPYPIPVLKDHNVNGWPSSVEGCAPYGRVYKAKMVSNNDESWVKTIAAITDPIAIRKVLFGEFLTVSIGGDTDEVYCSACLKLGDKINIVEEGLSCRHKRGDKIEIDGEEHIVHWVIGPLKAREQSFVNEPADVNARVITPSLSSARAKIYLAGTDGERLLDLAEGASQDFKSYITEEVGITESTYNLILKEANSRREAFINSLGKHMLKITGD